MLQVFSSNNHPKISVVMFSNLNLIFKDCFRLPKVTLTAKIIVTLTDDVEKRLRNTARTEYGNKRGALSIIVEEALKKYLVEERYRAR